jgi:hypothetical protein
MNTPLRDTRLGDIRLDLPSLRRRHEVVARSRALVCFDPPGAFASVARRPLLALMVVLAAAFAVVPAVAFLRSAEQQGGVAVVVGEQMRKSGAIERLKERGVDADDAVAKAARVMRVAVPGGAIAKRLLWLAFVAAACFFGLRATRPTLRFQTVAAAVCVGAAPLYVHDVLAAVGLLVLPASTIDSKNVVASNLAAVFYVNDNGSKAAASLRGLDVLELWACWLVGYGVVAVAGGRTRWPWVVTFGLHIVVTLVAIARA